MHHREYGIIKHIHSSCCHAISRQRAAAAARRMLAQQQGIQGSKNCFLVREEVLEPRFGASERFSTAQPVLSSNFKVVLLGTGSSIPFLKSGSLEVFSSSPSSASLLRFGFNRQAVFCFSLSRPHPSRAPPCCGLARESKRGRRMPPRRPLFQ